MSFLLRRRKSSFLTVSRSDFVNVTVREISSFVIIVVKHCAPRNLANIAKDLAVVYDAQKIT